MGIPDDFAAECLYAEDQWYVHDVLEVDAENNRVVTETDTTRLGAIVDAQKAWAGHPKHVPGMVMIQITGTLGNLHAVYALGLRMSEGWVGFGTNIHQARFKNIGRIGPPLRSTLHATRIRKLEGTVFGTYEFEFRQGDSVIYESKQTAAWTRSEPAEAARAP